MSDSLMEEFPTLLTEELTKILYTKYCESVEGKSRDGNVLPSWDEFSSDPDKSLQSNAWKNVALEAFHWVFKKFMYI